MVDGTRFGKNVNIAALECEAPVQPATLTGCHATPFWAAWLQTACYVDTDRVCWTQRPFSGRDHFCCFIAAFHRFSRSFSQSTLIECWPCWMCWNEHGWIHFLTHFSIFYLLFGVSCVCVLQRGKAGKDGKVDAHRPVTSTWDTCLARRGWLGGRCAVLGPACSRCQNNVLLSG